MENPPDPIKCPFCAGAWCYVTRDDLKHNAIAACNLKNQRMPLSTLMKLLEMMEGK